MRYLVLAVNLFMFICEFAAGLLIYRSHGKGLKYLTGFETSRMEKEEASSKYGKIMILMAFPFLISAVFDFINVTFKGYFIAFIFWFFGLIYLLKVRNDNERQDTDISA